MIFPGWGQCLDFFSVKKTEKDNLFNQNTTVETGVGASVRYNSIKLYKDVGMLT